jgi:predicted ester cyclase
MMGRLMPALPFSVGSPDRRQPARPAKAGHLAKLVTQFIEVPVESHVKICGLRETAAMNVFLERLFEAWTEVDDLSQIEARFAALYTDPVRVNGRAMSLADLAARARSLHAAFSGLRAEVLQIVEDAGSLAVAFVMHGRHTGPYETPLGTIEPTGSAVQIRTIDVLTIAGDRISSVWVNADDLGTLRQLGWQP